MPTISASDFDKIVSHTVRLELVDGSILFYPITLESKTALHKLLMTDAISDNKDIFLWIYIPNDRLVLINKKQLIRLTFCFDTPNGEQPKYLDNFNLLRDADLSADINSKIDNDNDNPPYLPDLIVAHNRKLENTEIVEGVTMQTEGYFGNISSYSGLDKGDVDGLQFEYLEDEDEWTLRTFKYLQFIDDDGEKNFMSLDNLSVIEIERSLLMSEEILDRYLERTTLKRRKKK